jgi:hypothetical protein
MWGKADETEYFPKSGLGATVVAVKSERETEKSLTGVVRGEKHGWRIASQTLEPGKVSGVYASMRLDWRTR